MSSTHIALAMRKRRELDYTLQATRLRRVRAFHALRLHATRLRRARASRARLHALRAVAAPSSLAHSPLRACVGRERHEHDYTLCVRSRRRARADYTLRACVGRERARVDHALRAVAGAEPRPKHAGRVGQPWWRAAASAPRSVSASCVPGPARRSRCRRDEASRYTARRSRRRWRRSVPSSEHRAGELGGARRGRRRPRACRRGTPPRRWRRPPRRPGTRAQLRLAQCGQVGLTNTTSVGLPSRLSVSSGIDRSAGSVRLAATSPSGTGAVRG